MTLKPRHWLAIALAFAAACTTLTQQALAQQPAAAIQLADPVSPAVIAALAPSGKLRVGLYPGSPSSLIRGDGKQGDRGVSFELGRALAGAIGAEFEPVVFQSNGELLAAILESRLAKKAPFLNYFDSEYDRSNLRQASFQRPSFQSMRPSRIESADWRAQITGKPQHNRL